MLNAGLNNTSEPRACISFHVAGLRSGSAGVPFADRWFGPSLAGSSGSAASGSGESSRRRGSCGHSGGIPHGQCHRLVLTRFYVALPREPLACASPHVMNCALLPASWRRAGLLHFKLTGNAGCSIVADILVRIGGHRRPLAAMPCTTAGPHGDAAQSSAEQYRFASFGATKACATLLGQRHSPATTREHQWRVLAGGPAARGTIWLHIPSRRIGSASASS